MSGRQGAARFVNLLLHPCQRVGNPLLRQIVDAGELEMRLDLRPQGGVVDARHLRPRMDKRPQGLAALRRGRRERLGNGGGLLLPVEAVKQVEHPLPESLGYRGAGEHGEKVAAAQAENAGLRRGVAALGNWKPVLGFWGDFNKLRHVRREFVGMGTVNARDFTFITVVESAGQFGGANPQAALVLDGGQGDVVEGQGRFHDELQVLSVGPAQNRQGREPKTAWNGRGRYRYPTPGLTAASYAMSAAENSLTGTKKATFYGRASVQAGVFGLRRTTTPQIRENVKGYGRAA